MRGGLATSVVLHAAILAWAILTIQAQRELRVTEPEPIAVDLVNISDFTRLRQGDRNAKQLEAKPQEAPKPEPAKKEAPKPTPAAAAPPPPPPPPPPEPKEEPKKQEVASIPPPPPPPAAPAPEEQKKLEELLKQQEREAEELKRAEEEKKAAEQRKADEQKRAEEERKAEEQRKAEEHKRLEEERRQAELKKKQEEEKKRKEAELKKKREEERKRKEAEAKKKEFDAEKIAALLNKVPDKGAPRPSVPLEEQAKSLNKGPVLGAPEGRDRTLSASERAVLGQIIKSCVQTKWNFSAGGEDAMNVVIKLRLQFRPDGTLAAPPQVMNHQNTPNFLIAEEGAIRAAHACEPYPLPPEKYEHWRDVVMNFDPREMR